MGCTLPSKEAQGEGIQSETDFKARELIFDIRRKKYERSSQDAIEVMKGLGDLLVRIKFVQEDKKRELILPTLSFLGRAILEMAISPPPVNAEGLQYMYQLCKEERANFIRETFDIDLEKLPTQDYEAMVWRYVEIFNELQGLTVKLLEGICHETFDDFLPDALKSTRPPRLSTANSQMPDPKKG